jgi:hypothetical protein
MNSDATFDFVHGKICNGKRYDLKGVIEELREAGAEIEDWPTASIIDLLAELSEIIADHSLDLHRRYPSSGLGYIAGWCRRSNLQFILQSAFNTGKVLDQFTTLGKRVDREYRALPVGLVAHWMAGNVPTLGFLSMIQGILTKNANLIKVASNQDDMLANLLQILGKTGKGKTYSGRKLVESIAVIRYDKAEFKPGKAISASANARVFWGSDETVNLLRQLPATMNCRDLVFGNKTSFMAIDRHVLEGNDFELLARRVAADVSLFEQKACASPHTLFLETQDDRILESMAEAIYKAMSRALRTYEKSPPSPQEVSAILNIRAQYDMFQRAWYPHGVEFTLLSDNLFQLGPPIGNRVLYLRKVDDLAKVADLISPQVQSVGLACCAKCFEAITRLFARRGVVRFSTIGAMTHFENPWDGYTLVHHLVRWVSRPASKFGE